MAWNDLFPKKSINYTQEYKKIIAKEEIAKGKWIKCPQCKNIIYNKDLNSNLKICDKCQYYFRMTAIERLNSLITANTFKEFDKELTSADPLNFKDLKKYTDRLTEANQATNLKEGVITGEGILEDYKLVIAIMDFNFMAGSMGSVVGEKITRAIEKAIEKKLPLIIISCSGGARMQEGMFSLMQMVKTSNAIGRLKQNNLLFISVLTDPTTGGVNASFSSLGDIIIAEKNATIGFAGKRVIQQTIRQKLPTNFQKAESLLQYGFLDLIVERKELKTTLAKILKIHLN